jgi:hypothetical protein
VNAWVHGNAARFAARNPRAFEDLDLEATLDELVCSTQPGDATAHDYDLLRHAGLSPTS